MMQPASGDVAILEGKEPSPVGQSRISLVEHRAYRWEWLPPLAAKAAPGRQKRNDGGTSAAFRSDNG